MDTMKDTTMQPATDAVIAEIKRAAEHPLKAPVIVRADAMLGILIRLEAAERIAEMLHRLLDAHRKDHAVIQKQNSQLRAKIEAMEKQEPVAEWLPLDSGEDTRRD